MLKRLRNQVFLKLFWGFMALFLLNCSIDTRDQNNLCFDENLAINDQESMVEFVLEQVLDFEDAIEEYDDVDPSQKKNVKKGKSIDPFHQMKVFSSQTAFYETRLFWLERNRFWKNPSRPILSPPPQA